MNQLYYMSANPWEKAQVIFQPLNPTDKLVGMEFDYSVTILAVQIANIVVAAESTDPIVHYYPEMCDMIIQEPRKFWYAPAAYRIPLGAIIRLECVPRVPITQVTFILH